MRKMADVLEVIDDNTAKVMLYKHKKCRGCGFCNKHIHPGSVVVAGNPVQAGQGEMVDVNVHKKFSPAEFAIAYLFPVVAFFGGLLISGQIFPGESGGAKSMGVAFLFLAAAIVINVMYRKNYRPVYSVSIVKRIRPAEPRL